MLRKYSYIQEHEKEMLELCSQGMTLQEIGEKLRFTHMAGPKRVSQES